MLPAGQSAVRAHPTAVPAHAASLSWHTPASACVRQHATAAEQRPEAPDEADEPGQKTPKYPAVSAELSPALTTSVVDGPSVDVA
jgi:hypothetical protein